MDLADYVDAVDGKAGKASTSSIPSTQSTCPVRTISSIWSLPSAILHVGIACEEDRKSAEAQSGFPELCIAPRHGWRAGKDRPVVNIGQPGVADRDEKSKAVICCQHHLLLFFLHGPYVFDLFAPGPG